MRSFFRAGILFMPTQGGGREAAETLGFAASRFQRWFPFV